MKKSDLKTGMTVELRDGKLYKVIKDVHTDNYGHQEYLFLRDKGFNIVDCYMEDLRNKNYSDFDVIKIYDKKSDGEILEIDTSKLLWERKEKSTVWKDYEVGDVCVWYGITQAIFKIKAFKGDCCSALNNIYYDSMHHEYVRKATDFEKILLGSNDIYIK